MSAPSPASRVPAVAHVVVWLARAAWLAVAIVGGQGIGEALSEHSRAVQVTGTVGAWVCWAIGAVALAIPAVVTLTLARGVVPGALVVAAIALVDRGDAASGAALLVPSIVVVALVGSAEFGRVYLQASAYGDEARFGLRPLIGYAIACSVTWLIAVTALVIAPLAIAGRAWLLAAVCSVVALAAIRLLPRRWHQLSRRWLVFVPAGIVVHDPVVLADTLMTPRASVESVALMDLGVRSAGAVDLTGPTPGLAVEVRLRGRTSAVLAPKPKQPEGLKVDFDAFVVSPTRPGAVIRAAHSIGYP